MRRPKDRTITALGFTCFRLEADGPDESYAPVELLQSTQRMFAFVRTRPVPPRRYASGGAITSPRRAALALLGRAR